MENQEVREGIVTRLLFGITPHLLLLTSPIESDFHTHEVSSGGSKKAHRLVLEYLYHLLCFSMGAGGSLHFRHDVSSLEKLSHAL